MATKLTCVKKLIVRDAKYVLLIGCVVAFWYLALFPGRLGYDYSLAIRMIQEGKSTDWWTSTFFWFLRISTIWGTSIFISSLIGILFLTFSIIWFVYSLDVSSKIRKITIFIVFLTPFFGVFGVTVSHDVFQTAGVIILLGCEVRFLKRETLNNWKLFLVLSITYILLLTTQTGIAIISISLISLIIRKHLITASFLALMVLSLMLVSSIGISKDFMKNAKYFPIMSDLKCIVQHPGAGVTDSEWETLQKISKKENWIQPVSCASIDTTVEILNLNNTNIVLDRKIIAAYIDLASRNPAILLMAHIQRSRGVFPPPFFQGPDNQVPLDTSIPIGLGTNTALQTGPELLHPSIDEPSVNLKIPFLKPLELIAQIPIFIVNQASWFWGWGGFWFWPILIFWLKNFKKRKIKFILLSLYPLILLHISLFILTPGALGRYYMPTILTGIIVSIVMVLEFLLNETEKKLGELRGDSGLTV